MLKFNGNSLKSLKALWKREKELTNWDKSINFLQEIPKNNDLNYLLMLIITFDQFQSILTILFNFFQFEGFN